MIIHTYIKRHLSILRKGTHDKANLVGARILVVEDNDINAEIATELLEEEGCIIERACNGVECIDMLEKADNSYLR